MICIICGMGVAGDLMAHRDATHPDVKKTIPVKDLFRKAEDDGQ